MCINEMSLSFLLEKFLCKEKDVNEKIIFYSFWSNFTLITFSRIKKFLKIQNLYQEHLGVI